MPTDITDIGSTLFSTIVGGDWQRTYASSKANGQRMFVFQRCGDASDIRVLRSDDVCPGAAEIQVPGYGDMFCHSFVNDPALDGLQNILERYDSCEVLRYRPGKRITIAATDRLHGPVIVKCVATGIDEIYARLAAAWEGRTGLEFTVGRPIDSDPHSGTFVQSRVSGVPIEFNSDKFDGPLVGRMAGALASLHHSKIVFPQQFDFSSQQLRSRRYTEIMHARMPELADMLHELNGALDNLGRRLRRRRNTPVPIHGSLHSHQWLRDGDQLALVDFDRAAMGDPELDIATFLAEFDYEPPALGAAVKRVFMAGFDNYDVSTLTYYRAHKHLAKAFKASKTSQANTALVKTRRNLGRALQILARNGKDVL